jgi:hypothetical protein
MWRNLVTACAKAAYGSGRGVSRESSNASSIAGTILWGLSPQTDVAVLILRFDSNGVRSHTVGVDKSNVEHKTPDRFRVRFQ